MRITLGAFGVIVALAGGIFLFNMGGASSVAMSLSAGALLLSIGARMIWKAATGSGELLEWMEARERQLLDRANAWHAGKRLRAPQTPEQEIRDVKDAIRRAQEARDAL